MVVLLAVWGCAADPRVEQPPVDSDLPIDSDEGSWWSVRAPFAPLEAPEEPIPSGPPPLWTEQALPDTDELPAYVDIEGSALAVADFDQDGLLDVVLPGPGPGRMYLQRAPRVFEEVTSSWMAGLDLTKASAATAVDWDSDGDLDVFVGRFMASAVLLRNDGGRFVDATAASGLVTPAWPTTGAAWGDLERDGDLDVYITNYYDRRVGGLHGLVLDENQFFLNNGDGSFTERRDLLPPIVRDGPTFTAGWHDLDDDGWLDLMVVNDFGQIKYSELIWNREGNLVLDDLGTGLHFRMEGMGMGVGDLNGDLVEDFVFSSQFTVKVQESQGNLLWALTGPARGLVVQRDARKQLYGWGTEIADFDADGLDDVVVGFGHWTGLDSEPQQNDALFRQQPDGTFVDVGIEEGVSAPGVTRGLVVADVDRDGCPDIVRRQIGSPALIHYAGCTGAWLAVELRDPGPNRFGVGAAIFVEASDQTWFRTVSAGSTSLFSGGPPEVLFGLGDARRAEVEVRWPDGAVDRIGAVRTGQRLVVDRPAR